MAAAGATGCGYLPIRAGEPAGVEEDACVGNGVRPGRDARAVKSILQHLAISGAAVLAAGIVVAAISMATPAVSAKTIGLLGSERAVAWGLESRIEPEGPSGPGLVYRLARIGHSDAGHDDEAHKWLFPLSSADIYGFITVLVSLIVVAGTGIGGGFILIPIFIMLLDFKPHEAVPLSNAAIFGGALVHFPLNSVKRHPAALDRPLVNWDLVLVMEPATIFGAIVGSYLNQVLPSILLLIGMVLILSFVAFKTYAIGWANWKKESAAFEATEAARAEQVPLLPEVGRSEDGPGMVDADPILEGALALDPRLRVEYVGHANAATATLPLGRFGAICGVQVAVLAVAVLGQSESCVDSGVCKIGLVGCEAALIAAVILCVRQYLIARDARRAELGFPASGADMAWTTETTVMYPSISTFAGVIAGTFGVGGGMVKGPLMLAMGVHPSAATATSATMIMFTSLTAVVTFVIMGTVKLIDYAIALAIISGLSTLIGQKIMDATVKKLGRPSVVIFLVATVASLSLCAMLLATYKTGFSALKPGR